MIHTFFHIIYIQDLWVIALLIAASIVLCSILGVLMPKKIKWIAALLAILSLAAILYVTIFSRSPTVAELHLIPFSAFERAKRQPEVYRSMLMNVFLFLPLGLSLPFVLRGGAGKRILLTALVGFALSLSIETVQFAFSLGMVEADDVLCNTVGAALGACAYPLSQLWRTLSHRSNTRAKAAFD